MSQRIVYWFRNDLRLQDNEGFFSALSHSEEVIPVYVFDPRQFAPTRLGFKRASAMRAKFLIECVTSLKKQLRAKGGDLIIKIGDPEKIVAQIAEQSGAQYVYTSKEIAPEETRTESSLSKNLKLHNIDFKLFWMHTVCNVSTLPFKISQLPDTFEKFHAALQPLLGSLTLSPEPETVNPIPAEINSDRIPSLANLGIDSSELPTGSNTIEYQEGESAALAKFNYILAQNTNWSKQTSSTDTLIDTQLSHWIAVGCLSPRYLFQKARESAYDPKILVDLLKRDYSHWTLLKYGNRLFKPSGIGHDFSLRWINDQTIFEKWIQSNTSETDINIAMHQLHDTGHLSFSQRNLVTNYLCNELGINWTWGAMYLESQLLDYDVAYNWHYWNIRAGVSKL